MRNGVRVAAWRVWTWNLWGFLCLAVILNHRDRHVSDGALFGDEPPHVNTWMLFFPYVWVPAVLVTIAVAGHIVITRRLMLGHGADDAD